MSISPQVTEEYTVRWPFFQEIIKRLGVTPTRDCFATEGNKRCHLYFSAKDEALQQEWPEDEILWLNPPWRLWPRVAERLMGCKNAAIVICPAWSKPWVQTLLCASDKRMYFEQGARMFEVDGKPATNNLWGTWSIRLYLGVRGQMDKGSFFQTAYLSLGGEC